MVIGRAAATLRSSMVKFSLKVGRLVDGTVPTYSTKEAQIFFFLNSERVHDQSESNR